MTRAPACAGPRKATPVFIQDLSRFSKQLRQSLDSYRQQHPEDPHPSHVEFQNLMAKAAGFRNLQALKAANEAWLTTPPLERVALPLSETAKKALSVFDRQGRLMRWPTKFSVQTLTLWPLWTYFECKRPYTEREVNAILKRVNLFHDHVTLRRELVNHGLLTRTDDCSTYRKLPARPDDEVRALLTAYRLRLAA